MSQFETEIPDNSLKPLKFSNKVELEAQRVTWIRGDSCCMSEAMNIRSILPKRYFTLDEAKSVLCAVKSHFEIAVIYNRRLDKAISKVRDLEGIAESRQRAAQIKDQLDQALVVVRKEGVEIADLSPGTLDFPALRNGEQVYLSWRTGDSTVSWWRPMMGRAKTHRRLVASDTVCWEWRN